VWTSEKKSQKDPPEKSQKDSPEKSPKKIQKGSLYVLNPKTFYPTSDIPTFLPLAPDIRLIMCDIISDISNK
jgi:hypothetical protein